MSEKTQIKVPDIGDFDKVPVIEVLVSEGDEIEKEQSLITLESEKATMEVPSSHAGRVVKVLVNEGDEVSEGDPIVEVEVEDETAEEDKAEEDEAKEDEAKVDKAEEDKAEEDEAKEDKVEESGKREKKERAEEKRKDDTGKELPPPPVPYADSELRPDELPHASPSVRKLARELDVDLAGIGGSGRKGRITEDDLKKYVKERLAEPASAATPGLRMAPAPRVDFSKFGEVEEQPLSRIKRISGPVVHRNWVGIPHVTQFDEADITEMEAFRKAHDEEAKEQGTRLTPLVFLIKAVVAGLREFPHFNASLSEDAESIVLKKYFHIGIAVDTEGGLVVPVVRDCDRKGLMELAHDLTELSGKARAGKLTREEMQGSCFSISSLGGIGGTAFTPIINAPDLAILGVSRAEMKPVWDGEAFTARLMLPLSLSYDHRVIDGADAVRFTRYLCAVLEDVRRLLL